MKRAVRGTRRQNRPVVRFTFVITEMGTGQSKIPYNPEYPRKLGEALSKGEVDQLHLDVEDQALYEEVMQLTASEFLLFMVKFGLQGLAQTKVPAGTRVETMKTNWRPFVKIWNESGEPVQATMNWHRARYPEEDRCEAGPITIQANTFGELPLPNDVDFTRELPLNHILLPREMHFTFPNGDVEKIGCINLNYGDYKAAVVLRPDRKYECRDEINRLFDEELNEEQSAVMDFVAETNDPRCPSATASQKNKVESLVRRILAAKPLV